MNKELFYELNLAFANFMGGEQKGGFFDTKNVYIRKGWLDWEVKPLKELK